MGARPFAFGRNWQAFVERHLDEERIGEAVKSLAAFCRGYDLKGRTFLCGELAPGLAGRAVRRCGRMQHRAVHGRAWCRGSAGHGPNARDGCAGAARAASGPRTGPDAGVAQKRCRYFM